MIISQSILGVFRRKTITDKQKSILRNSDYFQTET